MSNLRVIQSGSHHHLFHWSPGIIAYRLGFEFPAKDGEIASAVSPENDSADVSGWRPLMKFAQTEEPEVWVSDLSPIGDGAVAMSFSRNSANAALDFRQIDANGDLKIIDAQEFAKSEGVQSQTCLISDSTSGELYLLKIDHWGLESLHPIRHDRVGSAQYQFPSRADDFLAKYPRLLCGFVLAYLAHFAVLIAAVANFSVSAKNLSYRFGNQQAVLAPSWRRYFARACDTFLFLSLFIGFVWISFGDLVRERNLTSRVELAENLSQTEAILYEMTSPLELLDESYWIEEFVTWLYEFSQDTPELTFLVMFVFGLICGTYLYLQGRYGITPGKWLLGIRTVRATLRPASMTRILARELMLFAEVPMLVTPLPAVLSLYFSPNRQRWGDRIADTIVIKRTILTTNDQLDKTPGTKPQSNRVID